MYGNYQKLKYVDENVILIGGKGGHIYTMLAGVQYDLHTSLPYFIMIVGID